MFYTLGETPDPLLAAKFQLSSNFNKRVFNYRTRPLERIHIYSSSRQGGSTFVPPPVSRVDSASKPDGGPFS